MKIDMDVVNKGNALSTLTEFMALYNQLPRAYKEMAEMLHPKPLAEEVFRRTCALGLLQNKLDDGYQELMNDLEFNTTSNHLGSSS